MLEQGNRVGSQGEPDMQNGSRDEEFSARLIAAFETHVQLPLMGRSAVDTAEVKGLIDVLRERLDLLGSLLPGQAAARGGMRMLPDAAPPQPLPVAVEADDIGRNQRSRVRELVLLEALEAEHHALPLAQLTRALTEAGFDDTSAAIVSQLHRLKKLGVIAQPANGMYALTQSGVLHVRDLRRNFAHLKPT